MSPAGLLRWGAAELHAAPRTLGAGKEQLGEPCGTGVMFAGPCHPLPSPRLALSTQGIGTEEKKADAMVGHASVCSWCVRKQKRGQSEVDFSTQLL